MSGDGRRLVWWRGGSNQTAATRAGQFRLAGFTIAAHVVGVGPDDLLQNLGHSWRRLDGIADEDGNEVAAVWESAEGAVFLLFDPGEVMLNLWSERYTTLGRRGVGRTARSAMLRTYYLVLLLLPRRLQIMLRQIFAAQQGVPEFPQWPIEASLHDMYEWLFGLLTSIAGAPIPWIDVWPTGKTWAFVLTHDVETDAGVADRELLRAPERRHGFRSSWNFVPERYCLDQDVVRELRAEDCEIGVHGLRHDGRDLASRRMLSKRLPAMRAAADRWQAAGFRSPATQRHWELMPLLGFDYDSSIPTPIRTNPSPEAAAPIGRTSTRTWSSCQSHCRRITPSSACCEKPIPTCGARRPASSVNGAGWSLFWPIRTMRTIPSCSLRGRHCCPSSPRTPRCGRRCPGRSRPGGVTGRRPGWSASREPGRSRVRPRKLERSASARWRVAGSALISVARETSVYWAHALWTNRWPSNELHVLLYGLEGMLIR